MNLATAPAIAYDEAAERRHLALRSEFLLDSDVVFLNHGSFGACPRPVFERYQWWQRELERQPVEFLGRRLSGLMATARASLAEYLGADADELVYFSNVTAALNAVARSLPLGKGDEILTTNHEYGALERTWTFVAEHRQARLVVRDLIPPLGDPDEVVEAIWAGVTPRTRVLFLSHVTSPTALILPLAPLIARARAAGIWTVIDGAHAPGQVPVDLHGLDVDFYGGNCHKWLSAPKGAGFLYVRRELQDLIEPLVVSWGWRPTDPGPSRFVDENERQATRDPAAYLSVPEAIAFQGERDWSRVRAECHELARLARQGILDLGAETPLVADDPRWFAQMVSVPLPECDTEVLKARLYDEYRIEIPVGHARGSSIRVSVQGYNTRADIERLLEALGELLPQVSTRDR
jgi:isopenicillin-N epimerase